MAESHGKRFQVAPRYNDQPYNKHSAAINASDSVDYEQGRMRIVPPFTSDQRFLDLLANDVGVDLKLVASTGEATVLDFYVREYEPRVQSNEERVRITAQAIVDELGIVSSQVLFNRQFLKG